jgi:SNF2 family DNA or RNA helicase
VPDYFRLFRDELMVKFGNFKYVPKKDAVDKAYMALQPAVRYTLDDVLELPDVVERFVDVPMGKKQATIYDTLHKTALALVNQGETVTAANAGGIMSKLLQVSCGWVYATTGNIAELDNGTRIQALIDAIEGTSNKILVFATFKHATAGISDRITKAGYDDHAVVTGDTTPTKRNEIFQAFQKTDKYRILVAHPQCLAHGVTLTRADTIVWFNPTTNLEIYDQANQRIRRIGQKHKQFILHFQGSKVEKHVYNLLMRKQNVQSSFLELFKEAA